MAKVKVNPRRHNSTRRNRNRARLKAEGRPCWICLEFKRHATINYSLPPGHPGAFEVDELVPVSRWREGGYRSPEECSEDYSNLAAAHRACNQWRGNKSVQEVQAIAHRRTRGKRTDGQARASVSLPLPQPWEL